MTKADAEVMVKTYGSIKAACREAHVSGKTIRKALRSEGGPATVRVTAPAKKGRSLAEFRSSHDKSFIIPNKIREAIKALGASGWEYEVQFAKMAGLSLMDLGNYRDEFADYWLLVKSCGRRAWAGSAATALKMKEMSE